MIVGHDERERRGCLGLRLKNLPIFNKLVAASLWEVGLVRGRSCGFQAIEDEGYTRLLSMFSTIGVA